MHAFQSNHSWQNLNIIVRVNELQVTDLCAHLYEVEPTLHPNKVHYHACENCKEGK